MVISCLNEFGESTNSLCSTAMSSPWVALTIELSHLTVGTAEGESQGIFLVLNGEGEALLGQPDARGPFHIQNAAGG